MFIYLEDVDAFVKKSYFIVIATSAYCQQLSSRFLFSFFREEISPTKKNLKSQPPLPLDNALYCLMMHKILIRCSCSKITRCGPTFSRQKGGLHRSFCKADSYTASRVLSNFPLMYSFSPNLQLSLE